jgi:hypothetical protein
MSRTPRLVALSLSLYRLLLAAYPAAFRQEYGEAMVQLFRDTALDGYRQRGPWGLLAVWVRTLVDLAVSVGRQQREEAARPREPLSLRDLVQRWLALGCALLSVTTLSVRYLVLQRPRQTCAVASTVILVVWAGSFFHKLGIFSLGKHTCLTIYGGVIELRHIYARGEPISEHRFLTNPLYRNTTAGVKPWEFRFSSEHWIRSGNCPCKFWQLRFPVPVLLTFVLLVSWGSRGRFQQHTRFQPAIRSA